MAAPAGAKGGNEWQRPAPCILHSIRDTNTQTEDVQDIAQHGMHSDGRLLSARACASRSAAPRPAAGPGREQALQLPAHALKLVPAQKTTPRVNGKPAQHNAQRNALALAMQASRRLPTHLGMQQARRQLMAPLLEPQRRQSALEGRAA